MKDKLRRLLYSFYSCWYLHWMTSGSKDIQLHLTLEEIYKKLQDFCDEFVETEISLGNDVNSESNLNLKNQDLHIYADISIETFISVLKHIRNEWKEDVTYEFQDFQGRLVTFCNHYIFLLQSKPSTLQLMDTKDDQLIHEMRQLFKSQDEFVTLFNAYLKGRNVPNKIKEFFMKNEDRLTDLSNDILNINKQLFDEREFYKNRSKSDKDAYNEMVKYFDIFK